MPKYVPKRKKTLREIYAQGVVALSVQPMDALPTKEPPEAKKSPPAR